MRSSTSSSKVHEPSARALSTTAFPAGSIAPSASSRATRCLLVRAHSLPGRRRAKYSIVRCSSSFFAVLSTQPTRKASSISCS